MKEKKFDLLGADYTVKEVEEIEIENPDQYRTGEENNLKREILIARTAKGVVIDDRRKRVTLLHELFHAILDEGQYLDLSSNEPLIEWLARGTNAAIEQGIIQLKV